MHAGIVVGCAAVDLSQMLLLFWLVVSRDTNWSSASHTCLAVSDLLAGDAPPMTKLQPVGAQNRVPREDRGAARDKAGSCQGGEG